MARAVTAVLATGHWPRRPPPRARDASVSPAFAVHLSPDRPASLGYRPAPSPPSSASLSPATPDVSTRSSPIRVRRCLLSMTLAFGPTTRESLNLCSSSERWQRKLSVRCL